MREPAGRRMVLADLPGALIYQDARHGEVRRL
jgi:hypothetical protein